MRVPVHASGHRTARVCRWKLGCDEREGVRLWDEPCRRRPAYNAPMSNCPNFRDICVAALISVGILGTRTVSARVLDKNATIAGMNVSYKVVVPKDYDEGRAYPGILAF